MAYDTTLGNRVREYIAGLPGLEITEKKMFRGLCFMVNGKMCINISEDNLMCRFDPARQEEVAEKKGYRTMIMRGKQLSGYCYVEPEGFKTKKEFEYWVNLCLDFNDRAKASKK